MCECSCKEEKEEVVVINSAEELMEMFGINADYDDECDCTEDELCDICYDEEPYEDGDFEGEVDYFEHIIDISNDTINTLGELAELEGLVNCPDANIDKSFYNDCIREIKLDLREVI